MSLRDLSHPRIGFTVPAEIKDFVSFALFLRTSQENLIQWRSRLFKIHFFINFSHMGLELFFFLSFTYTERI